MSGLSFNFPGVSSRRLWTHFRIRYPCPSLSLLFCSPRDIYRFLSQLTRTLTLNLRWNTLRSPIPFEIITLEIISLRFSRKDYYFDSSSILRSRFAWFIDTNIFGGKNIGDTMAAIPITHSHVWFSVVIVRTRATSTRKKANLVWAKNYFSSHEGNFRDGSFFDFYFYFTLYSLMIFLSVWLKIIRTIKSLIFFLLSKFVKFIFKFSLLEFSSLIPFNDYSNKSSTIYTRKGSFFE